MERGRLRVLSRLRARCDLWTIGSTRFGVHGKNMDSDPTTTRRTCVQRKQISAKESTGRAAAAGMGNSLASAPPMLGETHDPTFVWKIHNFRNLLRRRGAATASSSLFSCSGFEWFLSVAPRCTVADSSSPVVSLCLGMSRNSMQLEPGYMVVAVFELSIYNHSNGMYYGYRDSSSFNVVHTNSKFKHLIPLNKLLKSSFLNKILKSSDFLLDDCCVFGVKLIKIDVYSPQNKAIEKGTTVQNLFIQKKGLMKQTYNVIINNFLQQKSKDPVRSSTFELGGHKWYLSVYPQGDQCSTGYLSLYMCLDASDSDPPLEPWTVVDVVVSILDQKYGVNHFRKSIGVVVYPGKKQCGFSNFCPLSTLKDRSRGYIVESRCVFQVEMAIIGSSNNNE